MEDDPSLPKRKKPLSPEQISNWNGQLFSWGFAAGLQKKQPLRQVFEVKEEYGTVYASGYFCALILSYFKEVPNE
jgi:hypothetical protein